MAFPKDYDSIVHGEHALDKTVDLQDVLHARVLSKSGTIIGKVVNVCLHPKTLRLEGIVVSRGLGKKKIYIGQRYINQFSGDAVILTIEPSLLLVGKRVFGKDGKIVGKVKEVIRRAQSNEVASIIVTSFFKRDTEIPWHMIKLTSHALLLRNNVQQKYFWQKS